MDLSINKLNNVSPVKRDVKFKGNYQTIQPATSQANDVYPVYCEVPYGINQMEYMKLGTQKLPNGDIMHCYILRNGQKVEIVQNQDKPVVATIIDVGADDEDGFHGGISHLIEHSMYHSSKNYPDVQKEIDSFKFSDNAFTTNKKTTYHITLNENNPYALKRAIEVQSDMLNNPEFSKLDKEIPVVCNESLMSLKDEYKTFLNKFDSYIYQNVPERMVVGTPDDIKNTTQQEMKQYWQKFYTPQNFNTFIASSFDPDEVIKIVAQNFNQRKVPNDSPTVHKENIPNNQFNRFDMISKTRSTGEVHFSFLTPLENNIQESTKIKALLKLLKLRNPILDGSVSQSVTNFPFDLKDTDEYELMEELKNELNEVVNNPISDSELETIKNQMQKENFEKIQENDDYIDFITDMLQGSVLPDISKTEETINGLTKEDIVSALKYFNFNNCTMGVMHPVGTTKEQIDEKYKSYMDSTKSFIHIPQYIEPINVQNAITAQTVQSDPAVGMVYSARLKDNTNLILTKSKNDYCKLRWSIKNPNVSINPAMEYLLCRYFPSALRSVEDKYKINKENAELDFIFDGSDMIYGKLECKKDNLSDFIKILKGDLNVNITQDDFKSLKEDALTYIENLEDETAYDKLKQEKSGMKYSKNKEYLKSELEKLTLEDVKKYINEMLSSSYSTVAISAPFNTMDDINYIASSINIPNYSFKLLDKDITNKEYIKTTTSKCYMAEKKDGQNEYKKVYRFKTIPDSRNKNVFRVLANILYDRIFYNIREKQGLSYSTGATCEYNDGTMTLFAQSNAKDEQEIKQVFDTYSSEIQKIMTQPVSNEELEKAKRTLKGEIFLDSHNANLINRLTNMGALDGLKDNIDTVNRITQDDILNAAKYIFSNQPDYCIDADKDILENNKEYFKTLGEIA